MVMSEQHSPGDGLWRYKRGGQPYLLSQYRGCCLMLQISSSAQTKNKSSLANWSYPLIRGNQNRALLLLSYLTEHCKGRARCALTGCKWKAAVIWTVMNLNYSRWQCVSTRIIWIFLCHAVTLAPKRHQMNFNQMAVLVFSIGHRWKPFFNKLLIRDSLFYKEHFVN